jgi:hypothetical protein
MPKSDVALPSDYSDWLTSLKQRIAGAQQRAAIAVNHELALLPRRSRIDLFSISSA